MIVLAFKASFTNNYKEETNMDYRSSTTDAAAGRTYGNDYSLFVSFLR